jgi:outer membrane protein OmpA-like peptidoglycan-associated protein
LLHSLTGKGAPPQQLAWSGDGGAGRLREGEIYQYQLSVTYRDGSSFTTGRDLFGVNRKEAVLLTLAGGAFVFDTWSLTAEAKRLLKGAARVLKTHPEEKVIIEGHTDGIGTAKYNIELSRKRCKEAADYHYLVQEEGIPASRLIRRWYGKSRPMADNGTDQGRRLNRRVELKGDFQERIPVAPKERFRTAPFVVINGRPIAVDTLGRFQTSVPAETAHLKVEMGDSLGRSLATTLPVPVLRLAGPVGERKAAYGSSDGWLFVSGSGSATCTLAGEVEPGTTLELQGRALSPDQEGRFTVPLQFGAGERVLGLVLRNGDGCSKLLNLRLVIGSPSPAARPVPEGQRP